MQSFLASRIRDFKCKATSSIFASLLRFDIVFLWGFRSVIRRNARLSMVRSSMVT